MASLTTEQFAQQSFMPRVTEQDRSEYQIRRVAVLGAEEIVAEFTRLLTCGLHPARPLLAAPKQLHNSAPARTRKSRD